ncbi:Very-long-chain 3-oxoacyl-CoA reductase [Blattella germanica]|nr:Very-long-chain 3-oxoacyl-CoA reductase [Blattella germanica]
MNIVLVGRQKEKLNELSSTIEFWYRVRTIVIEADHILENEEAYEEIKTKLWALDIGILINNVGMSSPHPEYFLDLPHRTRIYSQIIRNNILSVTNMTMLLLPRMVERNRGVIVNVASTAAIIPSPLLTVYGASKAYIVKFSRDLACEYANHGIIIQCIMPGFIAINKSEIDRPSLISPTPDEYVAQAVRTIGILQQTTGYFPHSLMVGIIHFFQYFTPSWIDWMILRNMENIRCRAIQKYVG